jgi:recombination protein RecA
LALSKQAAALAARINKDVGEGAAILASDLRDPPKMTSGSLSLDVTLGGGWAVNRWAEVYGPESHGKTAIVLKTIAANQAANSSFECMWVASEPYDADQAAALGVDNSRVLTIETRDMVVAYGTLLDGLGEQAFDAYVLDSYPALIAPDEDSKDMDENAQIGQGAFLTGKFFRKSGKAGFREPDERPYIGLFINQLRDAIGGWSPMGTPQTTPGGKGKNYSFWQRAEVKRDEYVLEGKTKVGQVIKVRTVKNKSAAPQRVALIEFYFADAPKHGYKRGDYNIIKDTVAMAILFDVIEQRGSHYYYDKYNWKSKNNVVEALQEVGGLVTKIRDDVLAAASKPEEKKRAWDEEDIDDAAE